MVVVRRDAQRVCVRLAWAFFLREKSTSDVQVPFLFFLGRLGDVQRHRNRSDKILGQRFEVNAALIG
jgi:hypothetical protein